MTPPNQFGVARDEKHLGVRKALLSWNCQGTWDGHIIRTDGLPVPTAPSCEIERKRSCFEEFLFIPAPMYEYRQEA
jgi:hypothetical protein